MIISPKCLLLWFIVIILIPNSVYATDLFNVTLKEADLENTGLIFTQVDRVVCDPSFIISEGILPSEPFDLNQSERFKSVLDRVFEEHGGYHGFKQTKNYTFFNRVSFWISNNRGEQYYFETDGVFWLLQHKVDRFNVSSKNDYRYIPEYYLNSTEENFRLMRLVIGFGFDEYLRKEKNISSVRCELSMTHPSDALLTVTNFVFGDYFDSLGCKYNKGDLIADCSNTEVFEIIPISVHFWPKKNSSTQETYYQGNNFIIMDKTDVDLNENENSDRTKLGNLIVFSESEFVLRLQMDDIGHLRYVRELTDIFLISKFHKIDKIESSIDDSISDLENRTTEIDRLFQSNKSLLEKQNELSRLSDLRQVKQLDVITISEEISRLQSKYYNFKGIVESEKDQYYADFYSGTSSFYLSLLNEKTSSLESKLNYYVDLRDNFRANTQQASISLQSEASQIEDLNAQRVALLVTLLFAGLTFLISSATSVFSKAQKKYPFKKRFKLKLLLISVVLFFILLSLVYILGSSSVGGWIFYLYVIFIVLVPLLIMFISFDLLSYREKVIVE